MFQEKIRLKKEQVGLHHFIPLLVTSVFFSIKCLRMILVCNSYFSDLFVEHIYVFYLKFLCATRFLPCFWPIEKKIFNFLCLYFWTLVIINFLFYFATKIDAGITVFPFRFIIFLNLMYPIWCEAGFQFYITFVSCSYPRNIYLKSSVT